MNHINRRSALAISSAAAAAVPALIWPANGSAQTSGGAGKEIAPGVRRVDYGKREAMFGGFKTVALRDHIYQPGSETKNAAMANDMVCHCLEGELQINQGPGMDFVVKKGDVWTCAKGMPENTKNTGTAVGIMRVTDLLPT
jgi:quercetin dioxygenase-like cupin family protein